MLCLLGRGVLGEVLYVRDVEGGVLEHRAKRELPTCLWHASESTMVRIFTLWQLNVWEPRQVTL